MPALARLETSALLLVAMLACGPRIKDASIVPGGDADRGRIALVAYGCGSCHVIPGVRGARGLVGPSLAELARKTHIAGVLPNDPQNIVRWILNPPAIDPVTAMPALGVTEQDARNMAEYIYRH